MIAFIDAHRAVHGVEPICKVLPIAPSTDRAHAARQGRSALICSNRGRRHRGVTQTKWPPANPARFKPGRGSIPTITATLSVTAAVGPSAWLHGEGPVYGGAATLSIGANHRVESRILPSERALRIASCVSSAVFNIL
ncbi:hypothetical protein HLK65_28965 [Azospirillum formosense]|nr:hypothetical protein [Azospirillum formosense]